MLKKIPSFVYLILIIILVIIVLLLMLDRNSVQYKSKELNACLNVADKYKKVENDMNDDDGGYLTVKELDKMFAIDKEYKLMTKKCLLKYK